MAQGKKKEQIKSSQKNKLTNTHTNYRFMHAYACRSIVHTALSDLERKSLSRNKTYSYSTSESDLPSCYFYKN